MPFETIKKPEAGSTKKPSEFMGTIGPDGRVYSNEALAAMKKALDEWDPFQMRDVLNRHSSSFVQPKRPDLYKAFLDFLKNPGDEAAANIVRGKLEFDARRSRQELPNKLSAAIKREIDQEGLEAIRNGAETDADESERIARWILWRGGKRYTKTPRS